MTEPFDPCGPLPPVASTTLLEASAGTGKTHTIAALATRLLAEEDVRPQDLLVITFGRSATAELRDRIRAQLSHSLEVLEHRRAPVHEVDRHLLTQPLEPARSRLRAALLNFDATTISTVHRFCSQAMRQLGILGESEPGETHLAGLDALATTAATDAFIAMAQDPHFTLSAKDARTKAIEAVTDGQSVISLDQLPSPDQDPSLAQHFAQAARARAERLRRSSGVVTYDDQILLLRHVMNDSPAAGQAAHVLRRLYPVVLVDEFQDTDEAQWEVLEAVFHGYSRLVLIGDPKQAIYAFRGGDVHTYERASRAAQHTKTLTTNYRSDPGVVAGVNLLFGDRVLSVAPRIRGERITAAQQESRLVTATGEPVPAFCGRILTRPGGVAVLRDDVAADTADQIVTALRSGWRLDQGGTLRDLRAADITVLTRTGYEADLVARELRDRGVACRVNSNDNVLRSPAARDWLAMLRALADPGYPARGNAAALALLGGSAAWLAADPDAFAERYGAALQRLRLVVAAGGFPALAAAVLGDESAMTAIGDERRLADLRHVAETLAAQQRATGMPVAALADWLAAQTVTPTIEQPLRRETEQPAVVVMTIHAAKGLQFPMVFVPFGWTGQHRDPNRSARFHHRGERLLDLREPCEGLSSSQAIADAEDDDEEMRLLYVALTRAVNRVVWHWAWLAYQGRTRRSALHRILGAAAADHERPEPEYDQDAWQEWARQTPAIDVTDVVRGDRVVMPESAPVPMPCQAADFSRHLDRDWSRRSFSSITRAAHDIAYADGATVDEPDRGEQPGDDVDELPMAGRVSPWSDLPSGTGFGTMVHQILEVTEGDRIDELLTNCRDALTRFRIPEVTSEQLAEALRLSMTTPLGSLVDNADLTAFGAVNRAAELDFEIALNTGADGGAATLAQLANLLAEEIPADDPLADYPQRLAELSGDLRLRGFLSGQIDAVLRWNSDTGPRYVVADYKTNWLGPWGGDQPLSTDHYGTAAMATAMMDSHYPLQALLYSVALHRHLRWRLADTYDPDQALGGVLYLFLRGMVGPDTPPDTGVFSWRPRASLIMRTSDLLSGVTSRGVPGVRR